MPILHLAREKERSLGGIERVRQTERPSKTLTTTADIAVCCSPLAKNSSSRSLDYRGSASLHKERSVVRAIGDTRARKQNHVHEQNQVDCRHGTGGEGSYKRGSLVAKCKSGTRRGGQHSARWSYKRRSVSLVMRIHV